MPKKRLIFSIVFLFILAAFAIFIRSQYTPPVLMYHSVNPHAQPQNRLAVTPKTFERQMRFLKRHRYNVIFLDDLATLIKAKKRLPERTVAITFDDGYADNFTYAFPILKNYNLPANLFIITDEVARPQGDRLSWQQIKEMQASGLVRIGSHALGPEPLVNLKSQEELISQIFDSKRVLEENLGRPISAFSYPEGRFTPHIRQLVISAGYQSAVATNPGKKFSNRDAFALKRIRISSSSRNLFVFWAEASGYYNFLREHRHK